MGGKRVTHFWMTRTKTTSPFGSTPTIAVMQDVDGYSELVCYSHNEQLATRIVILLNRNGLIDAPLQEPEVME